LNREGSAHVAPFDGTPAPDPWTDIWDHVAASAEPRESVDRLAAMARLPSVSNLPPGTPAVLVARCIAAFLAQAAFGRAEWRGENGCFDTAGYGGGVRFEWFGRFPPASERLAARADDDLLGISAYRFWFLARDQEPEICLEANGTAWDRNGVSYDLLTMYRNARRVWPVVYSFAGHLLP
jgi:hypothetical protein